MIGSFELKASRSMFWITCTTMAMAYGWNVSRKIFENFKTLDVGTRNVGIAAPSNLAAVTIWVLFLIFRGVSAVRRGQRRFHHEGGDVQYRRCDVRDGGRYITVALYLLEAGTCALFYLRQLEKRTWIELQTFPVTIVDYINLFLRRMRCERGRLTWFRPRIALLERSVVYYAEQLFRLILLQVEYALHPI